METIWLELRRRKVVRVEVAHAIGAWVLLQIGDTVYSLRLAGPELGELIGRHDECATLLKLSGFQQTLIANAKRRR